MLLPTYIAFDPEVDQSVAVPMVDPVVSYPWTRRLTVPLGNDDVLEEAYPATHREWLPSSA